MLWIYFSAQTIILTWEPEEAVWLSMAGSDMLAFIVAVITLVIMQRRISRKMQPAAPSMGMAQTDDTDD